MVTKPYYEKREITDFKDLINQSTAIYGNKNAFWIKGIMGEYTGITYKELKKDIDAVGTEFVNMGLRHERVAVIGENCYEWCLTYLGTTNGTGTIVPLDKELPTNEVKELLLRSHAKAVVFSEKLRKKILEIKGELPELKYLISMHASKEADGVLCFKDIIKKGYDLIKIGDKKFINARVDGKESTILLFTSGTTGLAKGVLLSQENICTDIRIVTSVVDVKESDTYLSILPLHHTYECTVGFLQMLYNGCTISFCEGLRHIVDNLKEVKPTTMIAVPLIYENMYNKIWDTARKQKKDKGLRFLVNLSNFLRKFNIDLRKKFFKSILNNFGGNIRLAIAGGAAVDPKVLKGLHDFGFFVIQGYGLTETSPIALVNHVQNYRHDALGLPLPELEVKIDNPDENGVGELLIKGKIVMQGYYENEEATNEVFTQDGWFKTGDLVRKDKDGFYYMAGRKKIVIVTKNGKNIFPEEVESCIGQSEYIKEILVYGKEVEGELEPRVAAVVFPDFDNVKREFGEEFSTEEIHKLIGAEIKKYNKLMPTYKYVKDFELRDTEFEKTTTRKIKRRR
ncbi:MAG: long-chain fatty acid--CoA ligase [Clostridiales bacterium]|nr:long-chain fatty acid--CoA ligase [Clostridiales bacterium]